MGLGAGVAAGGREARGSFQISWRRSVQPNSKFGTHNPTRVPMRVLPLNRGYGWKRRTHSDARAHCLTT